MITHEFDDGNEVTFAFTNYLGVNGTDQFEMDGILYVNSQTRYRDVLDGMDTTIMIGERPPVFDGWQGWWFAGAGLYPWFGSPDVVLGIRERIAINGRCRPDSPKSRYQYGTLKWEDDGHEWDKHAWHFWSLHPQRSFFLFASGAVDFVNYEIDQDVFQRLGTKAGGEVVNEF